MKKNIIRILTLICFVALSAKVYPIEVKVAEIKEGKNKDGVQYYFIKLVDCTPSTNCTLDTFLILSKKKDNIIYVNDTNYVKLEIGSVYDICLLSPFPVVSAMFDEQVFTNDSTIMWLGMGNNYHYSLAKGISDLYLNKPLSPAYGYDCTWIVVSRLKTDKKSRKQKRKGNVLH